MILGMLIIRWNYLAAKDLYNKGMLVTPTPNIWILQASHDSHRVLMLWVGVTKLLLSFI